MTEQEPPGKLQSPNEREMPMITGIAFLELPLCITPHTIHMSFEFIHLSISIMSWRCERENLSKKKLFIDQSYETFRSRTRIIELTNFNPVLCTVELRSLYSGQVKDRSIEREKDMYWQSGFGTIFEMHF